ncbi:hypothetical protein [uncultured Microbulbifer sp.]|uniref:hypothetical protein n=1 Tax=uncultured Microbulbifer sp. TaxID=348147 RepID=UPI00261555C0|nr:hypothetical protein [uncultured Microbulbifer sp.]
MKLKIIAFLSTIFTVVNAHSYDRLEGFYSAALERDPSDRAWQCYINSKYQEYIFSTVFERTGELEKLRQHKADIEFRNDLRDELVNTLESETINNHVHAKSIMLSNCLDKVGLEYSEKIYTCSYYDSALYNLNTLKKKGVSSVTATSKILEKWPHLQRVYFVKLVDRVYRSERPIDEETFFVLRQCLGNG